MTATVPLVLAVVPAGAAAVAVSAGVRPAGVRISSAGVRIAPAVPVTAAVGRGWLLRGRRGLRGGRRGRSRRGLRRCRRGRRGSRDRSARRCLRRARRSRGSGLVSGRCRTRTRSRRALTGRFRWVMSWCRRSWRRRCNRVARRGSARQRARRRRVVRASGPRYRVPLGRREHDPAVGLRRRGRLRFHCGRIRERDEIRGDPLHRHRQRQRQSHGCERRNCEHDRADAEQLSRAPTLCRQIVEISERRSHNAGRCGLPQVTLDTCG